MRCSRKLFGIAYRDHYITNDAVRDGIRPQAIGPEDDFLTTVKKRKFFKWLGHVSRSARCAETIL